MPIPDLLWACPRCGADRGLEDAGRHRFACTRCGTRYRRGHGALIHATYPDGSRETLEAGDWVDRLPTVSALVDGAGEGPIRAARVRVRRMVETDVVSGEDGFLNRIEIFGQPVPATLRLDPDRIRWEPDTGPADEWPLDRLTAVQASSRTLQLKVRGTPLVSFRFLDDSVFLWELLLQEVLRRYYRRTGRGEILEFQPRIVGRRGGGVDSDGDPAPSPDVAGEGPP